MVLWGVGLGGLLAGLGGLGARFGRLGGALVGPPLSEELVKYRGALLEGLLLPLLRGQLRSLWVWCRFLNGKDLGMDGRQKDMGLYRTTL